MASQPPLLIQAEQAEPERRCRKRPGPKPGRLPYGQFPSRGAP
jgi:hypothetical protein